MIGYCMAVKSAAASDYSPEYIEERWKALASVREQVRSNPKSGKSLKEILANLTAAAPRRPVEGTRRTKGGE